MRRIILCVLAVLMLPAIAQSASADVSGNGDVVRAASAAWWRHSGGTGTIYYIDVYAWTSSDSNRALADHATLVRIDCSVVKKGKPRKCDFRNVKIERVKVSMFSTDLALSTAHAVLRRGHSKADLTWTGRGDYGPPFVWQGISEYMFGPTFAGVFANAAVIAGRNASVEGRVFDLGFTKDERWGAGLVNFVEARASACTDSFFC